MIHKKFDDIKNIDFEKSFLLDVRSFDEVSHGTIDGAVNIPLSEIKNRLNEIPKDKEIFIFCAAGVRSALACEILIEKGYENVYDLFQGYNGYKKINKS